MSKIHINRDGTSLGIFTQEEVIQGLANGKFLATDLAWYEGMPEWKPLGELSELVTSGSSPSDAISDSTAGSSVAHGGSADGPAWEQRETLGFVPAMIETIKAVLLDPAATFSTMKQSGGFGNPLLFYAILSFVGGMVGLVYQLLIESSGLSPTLDSSENAATAAALTGGVGVVAGFFILPFAILIGAFVASGVQHLCLTLVGIATQPFEATFRVVMYASGAPAILQLVPFCGAYVGGIWALVLMVIGFTKVHNAPTGKTILAVLLPVIVCCGALVLIGIAAGGMGAFAALSQQ